MSEKGWIKFYRSIREHWVWEDPLLLRMWLDILLSANHDPKKTPINGTIVEIGRGQFWTSIRKLAERNEMDKDTVRKKLNLLQSDGMIFIDARKGIGTLITVRNYTKYQSIPTVSAKNINNSEENEEVYFEGADTESDRESDRESDKVQFRNRFENRHKQEDKELIRMNKEDKEIEPSADPWGNKLQ